MNSAVLYCIFNRLDVVKQTFEAIRAAKPPRLYVASDGARKSKEGEDKIVQAVRNYVLDNIDWCCEVKTLFQDENIGVDKAIPQAIDWLFENEEMGIILEDDILASNQFFDFCEKMLIKYKDDKRVRSISALAINTQVQSEYDYAFIPALIPIKRSMIWGWATYRRVWETIDFNVNDRLKKCLKDNMLQDILKREEEALYWSFSFKEHSVFGFTWDFAYIFNNLLQVPNNCCSISTTTKNLVTNIGYEGTHYDDKSSGHLGWQIDDIDTENLACAGEPIIDYEYLSKCADNVLDYEIEEFLKQKPAKMIIESFLKMLASFAKMLIAINPLARKRRYRRLNEKKYYFDKYIFLYKALKKKHKKV